MEQSKPKDLSAPNLKAAVLEKPEVKEAIAKFKETSNVELKKLCTEGLDFQDALNKLVDKLRSTRIQFQCTDRNLKLVKKLSGFDRGGALRVLLIREELVRLREQGYSTSDAIYELISRMRKLAGQKRGASLIGDLEEERIVKRRKINEERKSKKRTFDQASNAEDSQDFASGEEEIEHKKKKRKVSFENEESSVSEVSRSDAVKEDEPSITTDQEPEHGSLFDRLPRGTPAMKLFSQLFSMITGGGNNNENENDSDLDQGPTNLFLPHTPPADDLEPFDEEEDDQYDDEEFEHFEFNDDGQGFQNANLDEASSHEELPQFNNNSDSIDGDDDVNEDNSSKSRKRSRDLNSNESETEPKRKRTNNSSNNSRIFPSTKLM